jgi:ATP-binding cassette subfamily B protein RaxB
MLAFLSAQLQLQMSSNLFHHLIRLPLTFFERRHTGDIVSRFASTRQINQVISHRLIAALMDGLFSVATVIMMFVYEPLLATIAMGFTTAYTGARMGLLVPLRRRTLEEIALGAREQSTFIETLRAMQSIRLFGAEPLRETTWRNQFAARVNARFRVAIIEVLQDFARNSLIRLQSVVLLFFGARMVMSGELSIGMLLAFIAYSSEFELRSTAFIQQVMQLRLASLHLDRLSDIVHTPVEHTETTLPGAARSLGGHLELRGVSYRYGRDEPLLFADVDLTVQPGEFVAIAGASGQGKSTLLKLAVGLLEPLDGEVYVDGIPLRTFGLSAFRRQVATVMQEDQLLSGTIADNIAFFDTMPDIDRIHACAEQACIHDEIMRMPMAYDSMVGDMGAVLSGGQKQRVLLARALYRQPAILFMDEGTAHLDVETEENVNRNLKALSMTRVVIAHRPDMLAAADRIVRLESGELHAVDKDAIERVV